MELAGIAKDVGLPRGVFNVITGLGPDAGAPLSSHPGVDKVSYLHSGLIPTNYSVYTALFFSAFTAIREYVRMSNLCTARKWHGKEKAIEMSI